MLPFRSRIRTLTLIACLLLAALLFYSANLRRRAETTLFERAVLRVTSPLQAVLDGTWDGLWQGWSHYLWLVETASENDRLRLENAELRGELTEFEELRQANERLRRLLAFQEETLFEGVPAQVVAEDASSWFRTVVIDKGTRNGLVEGMPVVVPEGVVGRIIRCSAHQSRVMLATDGSSAVSSLNQRTRGRGICRGEGENLVFEYALRDADVVVGDRIISSGMGGVFPKGLLLGVVTEVQRESWGLFQTVRVKPVVDFARLEEVLVLTPQETAGEAAP